MSYTPTEWVTGDIVTAEKLNKLENAVANGVVPEYTSADKGKVLTLGEGSESEAVVVVPEQTVTVETSGSTVPITGADESYFVAGQQATLIVNGNEYNVTGVDPGIGSIFFVEASIGLGIGIMEGNVVLTAQQTGNYTVSMATEAPTTVPKWETAGDGNGGIILLQPITTFSYYDEDSMTDKTGTYTDYLQFYFYGMSNEVKGIIVSEDQFNAVANGNAIPVLTQNVKMLGTLDAKGYYVPLSQVQLSEVQSMEDFYCAVSDEAFTFAPSTTAGIFTFKNATNFKAVGIGLYDRLGNTFDVLVIPDNVEWKKTASGIQS